MLNGLLGAHHSGIKHDELDDLLTRLDPRDASMIKQECEVAMSIDDISVKVYRNGNEVFAVHDRGQAVAYGRWESTHSKATNILVQGGYEYGCENVPKQIFYDLIMKENREAESSRSDTKRMIDFWFRMSMYAQENGCSVHFVEDEKILPFDVWRKPKGTILYKRR